MYDKIKGKRCAVCGFRWKPSGNVADDYPTKETGATCGDIISNQFEGVSRAAVTKRHCTDGTTCSITPSSIKRVDGNVWMVVCSHHNDG